MDGGLEAGFDARGMAGGGGRTRESGREEGARSGEDFRPE